ncbi:hypothetical protein FA15DRAFT_661193 [Coprinopsis marcescibilis]|uniref:Uncharacterized protein n=1 Tax=Coprinopsis marcescibilis TaxID=230819 RepID=A0A5C3KD06_COPMA|nr:hypothetical protein FA15DRAFT_661193 [Coprinopsis marcescibilis]
MCVMGVKAHTPITGLDCLDCVCGGWVGNLMSQLQSWTLQSWTACMVDVKAHATVTVLDCSWTARMAWTMCVMGVKAHVTVTVLDCMVGVKARVTVTVLDCIWQVQAKTVGATGYIPRFASIQAYSPGLYCADIVWIFPECSPHTCSSLAYIINTTLDKFCNPFVVIGQLKIVREHISKLQQL